MAMNIPVDNIQSPTQTVETTADPSKTETKPSSASYLKGEALLQRCVRMRKEGNAAKKLRTSDWDELSKFALGTQWPARMPKYKIPATMNFVFGLIERKAALLTDTNPIIKIGTTLEHTSSEHRLQMSRCAKALELYIANLWTRRSAGVKFFDFFQLAEIFGGCGVNIPWSSSLDHRGGIEPARHIP